MKVLIACEESQTSCIAFRHLGHTAFSCDIQDCSGGHPEWHIKSDVLDVLYDDWDLIIAHPPCTYLTCSSSSRLFISPGVISEERFKLGLDAKEFFMKFYNAPCKRICIENPLPLKIFELPEYNQVIHPYYFGEPYSKRTCLWLKNLPLLFATCFVDDVSSWVMTHYGSVQRSKSFPGIASAMAMQWGSLT